MRRQIDTELRTLSGTTNPYVVPYLHAYSEDGNVAIVMEYMDGGSLCGVVRQGGVLQEPVLAEIARQTLQVRLWQLLARRPAVDGAGRLFRYAIGASQLILCGGLFQQNVAVLAPLKTASHGTMPAPAGPAIPAWAAGNSSGHQAI